MTTNPQHQEPSLKERIDEIEGYLAYAQRLLTHSNTKPDAEMTEAINTLVAGFNRAVAALRTSAETASKTEAATKEIEFQRDLMEVGRRKWPLDLMIATKLDAYNWVLALLSKPSTANLDSREDS